MLANENPSYKSPALQVPTRIDYPKISLGKLLKESSEKFSNQVCIQHELQSFTFKQADAISDRIRDGLVALGYKKGDRIALLLPNIPQFVLAFFGIVKFGGIVVAINPGYQSREIKNQLACAKVSGLFLLQSSLKLTPEFNQLIPNLKYVSIEENDSVSLTDIDTQVIGKQVYDRDRNNSNIINLKNLLSLSGSTNTNISDEVSHNDPAIFQFSGGTTGVPKAAVGLHSNVVANVYQFRTWLKSIEDVQNPFLVAIPLFHVYGMVLGMVLAILMGCPMILVSNPGKVINIFKALRTYKPTVFPSVPSQFYGMLHSPDLEQYKQDILNLKVCISGSASLQPGIKLEFEKLIGGNLIEGYGLSEAPTATHCNPLTGPNKVGSIGLPLPGVECRLVSIEDGHHNVVDGRLGELILRGPQVMKEYFGDPRETEIALRNGWLYTGDIAWKDADGYYFIKGRKKDLIKVGGLQVWPQEVEEVISLLPEVKETTTAGVPDEHLGEVVYAWVVKKPGTELSAQTVIEHCRENLARHKVPVNVKFLDDLPRSTVGKVLRRELVRSIFEKQD